jgi:hypothetical protein
MSGTDDPMLELRLPLSVVRALTRAITDYIGRQPRERGMQIMEAIHGVTPEEAAAMAETAAADMWSLIARPSPTAPTNQGISGTEAPSPAEDGLRVTDACRERAAKMN